MRKIRLIKINRQLQVRGFRKNMFRKLSKKYILESMTFMLFEIGKIENFTFIEG